MTGHAPTHYHIHLLTILVSFLPYCLHQVVINIYKSIAIYVLDDGGSVYGMSIVNGGGCTPGSNLCFYLNPTIISCMRGDDFFLLIFWNFSTTYECSFNLAFTALTLHAQLYPCINRSTPAFTALTPLAQL